MEKKSLIILTTDFGFHGPFVGIMQGVMLGINPFLDFVHLSHGIKQYNILQAAYVLGASYPFFPAGAIHLIVVDPGVGSDRKFLLVKSKKYSFFAPDNGVLSVIFQKEKEYDVYQLDTEKFINGKISSTFHGRDVFAPAAALFSLNHDPGLLGHKVESCVRINLPEPQKVSLRTFSGEIIYIDHFGNLISNFSDQFISQHIGNKPIKTKIGSCQISGLKSHYAGAGFNEISALINSWNNLEIFLPSASAAEFLKAKVGDIVEINA